MIMTFYSKHAKEHVMLCNYMYISLYDVYMTIKMILFIVFYTIYE